MRADHLEAAEQVAHDGGVVGVSRDGVLGQVRLGLSVGVVAEEGGGLSVWCRPRGATHPVLLIPPPERLLDGGNALRPTDRPRVDERAVVPAPAIYRKVATPRVVAKLATGQAGLDPVGDAQAEVSINGLVHRSGGDSILNYQ